MWHAKTNEVPVLDKQNCKPWYIQTKVREVKAKAPHKSNEITDSRTYRNLVFLIWLLWEKLTDGFLSPNVGC